MSIVNSLSEEVLRSLAIDTLEAHVELYDVVDYSFIIARSNLGLKRFLPHHAYKLCKQKRNIRKMKRSFPFSVEAIKFSIDSRNRTRMEQFLNEWTIMIQDHKDQLVDVFAWLEHPDSAASAEDFYMSYTFGGGGPL